MQVDRENLPIFGNDISWNIIAETPIGRVGTCGCEIIFGIEDTIYSLCPPLVERFIRNVDTITVGDWGTADIYSVYINLTGSPSNLGVKEDDLLVSDLQEVWHAIWLRMPFSKVGIVGRTYHNVFSKYPAPARSDKPIARCCTDREYYDLLPSAPALAS